MKLAIRMSALQGYGFRAWCPALPGCAVSATTEDEAKSRIRDAVVGYLGSLEVALPRELGKKLDEADGGARVA